MIDRRLVFLLAAATGCMRIDPDPELPDVIVEWVAACGDDGATVRIDATAPDGTRVSQDAECASGKLRLEDLGRTPHTIAATLLDASGALLGRASPSSVDLADGHSHRTSLSFFARTGSFVRVAWTLPGEDTCISLGVMHMTLAFRSDDGDRSERGLCEVGKFDYDFPIPAGRYTLQLFARQADAPVAVAASELRRDVVIPARGETIDLGTVALTRCAPLCEVPLPRPTPESPEDDRALQ